MALPWTWQAGSRSLFCKQTIYEVGTPHLHRGRIKAKQSARVTLDRYYGKLGRSCLDMVVYCLDSRRRCRELIVDVLLNQYSTWVWGGSSSSGRSSLSVDVTRAIQVPYTRRTTAHVLYLRYTPCGTYLVLLSCTSCVLQVPSRWRCAT